MTNYYAIDGKVYYLNLNNIFSMVTETPNSEKLVNTTITQIYGELENEEGNGKEVVESKSNLNETMNNIRYDIVKRLIECFLSPRYIDDGTLVSVNNLTNMSLAQGICFNTLIENNILVELETSNE